MLINSRVAAPAATSVYRNGAAVDLRSLPDKALEDTTDGRASFVSPAAFPATPRYTTSTRIGSNSNASVSAVMPVSE
jgi:hypothetical protein